MAALDAEIKAKQELRQKQKILEELEKLDRAEAAAKKAERERKATQQRGTTYVQDEMSRSRSRDEESSTTLPSLEISTGGDPPFSPLSARTEHVGDVNDPSSQYSL